ncbi:MAG: hypothetical protein JWL59_325 [Chthoniobacteraceae bacterium]|nr:hypothetical protein [Chthoniobacteraceae bacterium]
MASIILRWAIGLLFLCAGLLKASDAQQFAMDVQNYELTSWTFSILIAVYLPWLEIVSGIALIARRLYSGALAASTVMTAAFLAAILSAWWRDLDIACGCFGPEINHTNYPLHIIGNTLLLLALAFLKITERRSNLQPAQPGIS